MLSVTFRPRSRRYTYLLTGRLGGTQRLSGDFGRGKYLRLLACSSRTEFAIPTELSGMPHIKCITYVNYKSRTVSVVCALYQKLRPFSRFKCSCTTERRNMMGKSRNRCRLGREKFPEIYTMDDVDLG